MRSRYFVVFIVLFPILILSVGSLAAQLNRLDSASELSEDSILLGFTDLLEGTSGGAVLNAWGVLVRSSAGTEEPVILLDLVGGQPLSALSNPNDGASEGDALVIDLRRGVLQISFTLRNGGPDTSALIRAFDVAGAELGAFQVDMVNTTFGPFVGLETTDEDRLIHKVVIDYEDSPNAEQITDLGLTFPQDPFFTTFLAQIGDGAVMENFIQTSIIVTNLTNTTAQGQVRITGQDGNPLDLAFIDEESGETIAPAGSEGLVPLFPVPAHSSRVFTSLGTDISPPVEGYAEIRSNVPISATAVFRAVIGGELFEAGVGESPLLHRISAPVSRDDEGSDSGIAVANPNDVPASARLQLLDSNGVEVAMNTQFLELGPGEHVAGFLPQIFEDIPANFQGSILILSEVPLSATLLRTIQGGVVSASLPVGGTELPQ